MIGFVPDDLKKQWRINKGSLMYMSSKKTYHGFELMGVWVSRLLDYTAVSYGRLRIRS